MRHFDKGTKKHKEMNLRQHGIAVNFSINGSNIEITLLLMIFLACLLRAHTKQQRCENNEKIN